ncbi:MAG: MarR family transcriptional regulator, partial [Actinomycetota bacterium]
MAHQSEPAFRAFHALRIKGFAKVDMVADIADVSEAEAEAHLKALLEREHAMFREARALWQITPAGKEAHREALAADSPASVTAALHDSYETFLGINTAFKELCGDWQLRDGQPN